MEARASVRAGEAVRLYIDPSRLRFFDPETTEAIRFATPAGGGAGRGGEAEAVIAGSEPRATEILSDDPSEGQARDAELIFQRSTWRCSRCEPTR